MAGGWWSARSAKRRANVSLPIGIGLPLQSEYVAEMLLENHLRRWRVA